MKLRSKKTGEVIELNLVRANCEYLINHKVDTIYGEELSLKTLNKYYKDYKPKEPLIKDEKIRKAVRAWAKVNRDVNEVIYKYDTNTPYCEIVDNRSAAKIRFNFLFIKELNTYEVYTIAELCGEEE